MGFLNGKISFRFFNENMNTELFVDILKKSKMKNLWGKGFILMIDNTPYRVSDKIVEHMKSTKIKEWKDWRSYSPDLNPIENIKYY